MIDKIIATRPGYVRVIFQLPASLWADQVYLVGEFNQWNDRATSFQQGRDGVWRAVVDLAVGKSYQFRYLVDGQWQTDYHADGWVGNEYGSYNSIVHALLPEDLAMLDQPGSLIREEQPLQRKPYYFTPATGVRLGSLPVPRENGVKSSLKENANMAWQIDPAHSHIMFTVRHMMISNVRGRFEKFDGVVEFNEQQPTQSRVEIQVEAASINTREEKRDAHLRSPDFLNAAEYPYLTFKSKRVEKIDDQYGLIVGDLTIRGVTREAVLDTDYSGQAKSPLGDIRAGFTASTHLNRKNWGLNWNVALETGGWLVSDEVNISIELEIVKQAEATLEEEVALAA